MLEKFEEKHHQLEDTHWFLRARRSLIKKILKTRKFNTRILEVGCSTGALLFELQKKGFTFLYGVDISSSAISACSKRGLHNTLLIEADKPLPFKNETFDVVISSDVLEHIENEKSALCEWRRVLRTGGELIILVPAFNILWSEHDLVNGHFRRYTKKNLVEVLIKNGFKVKNTWYWNSFLFLPILAIRSVQGLMPSRKKHENQDQLYSFPSIIEKLLESLLTFEGACIERGISLPVGVSAVAVAAKE